jgi:hypothetical protein
MALQRQIACALAASIVVGGSIEPVSIIYEFTRNVRRLQIGMLHSSDMHDTY